MTDPARGPSNGVPGQSPPRERRRHRRFLPRQCALELHRNRGLRDLFTRGPQNLARAVLDLSEGGARFVTSIRLRPGETVRVTVRVELLNDTFHAAGTVAWCANHPPRAGLYQIGVRFDGLPPANARKVAGLRDYLNSPEVRQKEETRRREQKRTDTSGLEVSA